MNPMIKHYTPTPGQILKIQKHQRSIHQTIKHQMKCTPSLLETCGQSLLHIITITTCFTSGCQNINSTFDQSRVFFSSQRVTVLPQLSKLKWKRQEPGRVGRKAQACHHYYNKTQAEIAEGAFNNYYKAATAKISRLFSQ